MVIRSVPCHLGGVSAPGPLPGGVALGGLLLVSVLLLSPVTALAQAPQTAQARPAMVASDDGPQWKTLSPQQQKYLAPLATDWARLEPTQRYKWVEMAQRMAKMPEGERERIQARMADWANMSPNDRAQARLRFLQARRTEPANRSTRWEDYQALPGDQKKQLAARAPQVGPPQTTAARKAALERNGRAERADGKSTLEKSNIVPNPAAYAAAPRTVSPTVIQARPGATTTFMSQKPLPPAHQQTGLPKIAAYPGFIDKDTLLPKRGPQGAAAMSVGAASAPTMVPRP